MAVTDYFTNMVTELETIESALANVTLGTLTLGAREATTGYRAITLPTSTIKMVIIPKGGTFVYSGIGLYAYETPLGLVNSTVKIGDQIKTGDNRYFKIASLEKVYHLNKFAFWKAQLDATPFWQAEPAVITWSKTRNADSRKNNKIFIDTYLRVGQITKDDDSTQALWCCMWNDPPYPLHQEFRAGSSPVFGIYVVGQPKIQSQIGVRYTEIQPIHIYAVNSTDCTGIILNSKMESELRYQVELNAHGSLRLSEAIEGRTLRFGPLAVFMTSFFLHYRRTSELGKA